MYDLNLAMRIKRMRRRKTHNRAKKTYHIQHIIHEKISQFQFAESFAIKSQSKFVLTQSKFGLSLRTFVLSQSKFVLS